MPIETYPQALDFWYARINYEQRGMPADLRELKLDRMRELLDRLGNPQRGLRIVHVAGSKGKGSTAAMLASIFHHAGHRAGLFTSPHLTRVEERCQIDGVPLSEGELIGLMRQLEPHVLALESAGLPPTFFEMVTAIGFLHFARQGADPAVIEVGLGGRFDSTNVCDPLVSIITSISLDHTEQLGDTLTSIAREKAGIIKPGRPVISGVQADDARAVIEAVARRCRSPLRQLGRDFVYQYQPGLVTAEQRIDPRVAVGSSTRQWPELKLGLLGEHQAANAALAVACVEELRTLRIDVPDAAVREGLQRVHWPGRMEVLGDRLGDALGDQPGGRLDRRPFVVLDCAHNVASMEALVATLQSSFPPTRRILVLACSRDKDLAGMLRVVTPHFQQAYLTRYTTSARGACPQELADLWRQAGGGACQVVQGPLAALEAARTAAGADGLVCVAGSVFLAGEVRPALLRQATGE